MQAPTTSTHPLKTTILKGKLISPTFNMQHTVLSLSVGGGNMPETRKVSFIVNDREVRSVTGQRSEVLNENFWDVSGFVGQNARIEILDD